MIKRGDVEDKLLGGIKEQLLDPAFAKAMANRVRAVARQKPKAKSAGTALKTLDRQIKDLAETICEVGRSDILTKKLKDLESEKRQLAADVSAQKATPVNLLAGAADQWTKIVSNLEDLRHYAKPDEMDSARAAIREIVGEISVFEKDSHVFAKTKLSENVGFKTGAQKRT